MPRFTVQSRTACAVISCACDLNKSSATVSLAVAIIFGVINTRNASRRNPPIGEEMHKVFVPRKEWDDSVQRIHVRIDQTRDVITASEASTGSKIDSLRTDMNKVFHDVERALGRVEGQLEEKKK